MKKVVVFAHHKDVLNTIAKHFGVRAVVIHGDISLQDRQSAVDRFQGDPTVEVAVISIKAGGVGITLTAASTEFFAELERVSNNQIIWGANHFISRIPFDSPCWIVWDKDNGKSDFADCELAWTSFKTSVRKFTFRWNGMLQGNMKQKEFRIHPTQKPRFLYQWILQNYAKPNDKILDTHGGSMSIAIACELEGFDLDICEIDKEYFQAGVNAFNLHKRQQRLF